MILILLGVLSFTASCRDLLTPHTVDMDGTMHGEKLTQGSPEDNCTACHGANLNGNGFIPGCTNCHGVLWNKDSHKVNRGGVTHYHGLQVKETCGSCHGGSSLQGKRSRPSCYQCHSDVWSELAIHTVSQDGILHAPGLNSPYQNCADCHGNSLTGLGSAPSCYQCHDDKWDDENDKATMSILKNEFTHYLRQKKAK